QERRQELARQNEERARETLDSARRVVDLAGLKVTELIRAGRRPIRYCARPMRLQPMPSSWAAVA
ncbi:hypothetical protein, partial [Halomonas sp. BC04]|uniref:hypothetical protein n=1 Tax=Halomonas sp. BC04 TaxID=1403540 RepID=UPI001E29AEED